MPYKVQYPEFLEAFWTSVPWSFWQCTCAHMNQTLPHIQTDINRPGEPNQCPSSYHLNVPLLGISLWHICITSPEADTSQAYKPFLPNVAPKKRKIKLLIYQLNLFLIYQFNMFIPQVPVSATDFTCEYSLKRYQAKYFKQKNLFFAKSCFTWNS